MTVTAHWGTFDAEAHWRPGDLAELPAVGNRQGRLQVESMDELLVCLCAPGDPLLTRHPVPQRLREAWHDAGLRPSWHQVRGDGATAETAILTDPEALAVVAGSAAVAPYAVLPATAALATATGHTGSLPPVATVARVNSKAFSDDLVHRLGLPGAGRVVASTAELRRAVEEIGGPAMVKDPYGVGGRGILEIRSPAVLETVIGFLQRQAGRRTELVVQPRWPKRADLSGYVRISRAGQVTPIGIQVAHHQGLSHTGFGPLPAGLLDADRYTETLLLAAAELAATGYTGPAGFDSLLCDDGGLIPILEINARVTVGMLSAALDDRAREHGLRACLWRTRLAVPDGAGVDDLLDELHRDGLLYRGGPEPGVLPLTGAALRPPRARLECALFCPPEETGRWRDRLRTAAGRMAAVLR
ncbi:hypothetical protein [Catenuloplanes indicus]|uniref:ATP-grasp domain-containing protein n=1 Tax=Catenuloplanes indicus TaxID=137267 RepID=A0AAE3VVR7_9ACTN|nr:hypothetical protein [Catenuloplanes indicus]MDQ0364928.1 hypothetical protein [Catenuloplanes indicus]